MKFSRMLTVDDIVETVAAHYGLTPDDLRGKKRNRQMVEARGVAMYLIRKRMNRPFTQIGEYFFRDHSIVLYSNQKVEQRIQAESEFKDCIEQISDKLKAFQY